MLIRFISGRRPRTPKNELTMRRLVKRYLWMTTGLALVAGLGVTLSTTQSQAKAAGSTSGVKPTVVLVNGAWANNASWSGVIQRLQAEGYTVDAPPNPLQSLNGDARTIADFLKTISGPIVLVGHSYGGAVITNAARGNRNVKALVYVDAFAPAKGESVLKLDLSKPGSALGAPPKKVLTSCRSPVPRRATPCSTSRLRCSSGRSPTGSRRRRARFSPPPEAGARRYVFSHRGEPVPARRLTAAATDPYFIRRHRPHDGRAGVSELGGPIDFEVSDGVTEGFASSHRDDLVDRPLTHSSKRGIIMREFTVGNYLATRLEQIGVDHYFVVLCQGAHGLSLTRWCARVCANRTATSVQTRNNHRSHP